MSQPYQIVVEGEVPTNFPCLPGEALLAAMQRAGRRDLPVGCRAGGCGACRIRVLSGDYDTGRMSRAHVNEQEQAAGYALACRVVPSSDLRIVPASRLPQTMGKPPRREHHAKPQHSPAGGD